MKTKHRSCLAHQEREAISQLHGLLNKQGLLRASFVRVRRSCGRAYCRCMRSKRNWHQGWYIVQRHGGRPRMKYIPLEMQEKVRQWIARYGAVKELLNEVSDVYWEAIKKKP